MTVPHYSYSALPPNPPLLNLTSHSPNYYLLRSLQKNWTYRSLIHIPICRPALGLVAGDHYFEWRVSGTYNLDLLFQLFSTITLAFTVFPLYFANSTFILYPFLYSFL